MRFTVWGRFLDGMGDFHDDIILLQLPESSVSFLSYFADNNAPKLEIFFTPQCEFLAEAIKVFLPNRSLFTEMNRSEIRKKK